MLSSLSYLKYTYGAVCSAQCAKLREGDGTCSGCCRSEPKADLHQRCRKKGPQCSILNETINCHLGAARVLCRRAANVAAFPPVTLTKSYSAPMRFQGDEAPRQGLRDVHHGIQVGTVYIDDSYTLVGIVALLSLLCKMPQALRSTTSRAASGRPFRPTSDLDSQPNSCGPRLTARPRFPSHSIRRSAENAQRRASVYAARVAALATECKQVGNQRQRLHCRDCRVASISGR